jgi:hypothetical protein
VIFGFNEIDKYFIEAKKMLQLCNPKKNKIYL